MNYLRRILRTWLSLFIVILWLVPKITIDYFIPPAIPLFPKPQIYRYQFHTTVKHGRSERWLVHGIGSSRWWRRRRAHDSTTPTRRHWKETILDPSSRHMQAEYGYLLWTPPLQIGPAPRYTQSLLIGTWDMRLEPHICVCFMFVYIWNIFTITRANFDAYCKC